MTYHLQSLVRVIELILCHEKQHKYFDDNNTTPQLYSLMEKACFLRDSFELLSQESASSLEDQIQDAAENAEDVLETYVSVFEKEDAAAPTPDLQNLLEKLDSAKDEMMKLLDGDQVSAENAEDVLATHVSVCEKGDAVPTPDLQNLPEKLDSAEDEMKLLLDGDQISADKAPPAVASSEIDQSSENIVVGFEEDILQLKDRVFGDSSKLEIIPIVGMGGIGKTTLARKIYDSSSDDFDVRAWATVSDDYSLGDILLCLLGDERDGMMGDENEKLGLLLHQHLMGRRYLLVLDDIWRSNAWDAVKKFFPNDNKGSRIILTTRQSDVANYVDPTSPQHQVLPLSEADSWKLLKEKVFGEKDCLPELEKHGITIANSCKGLPLAIQVVGGLLLDIKRTKTSWKQFARKVMSVIANKDEHISSILSVSYDRLPYCLKPCFLYLSAFPEDYNITQSKLIKLWAADGFLKPNQGKSLEETAEEYINALIDRNLIFISRRTFSGKVKFLRMHDLLRDLSTQKARDRKFFHLIKFSENKKSSEDMSCLRRVSVLRCENFEKVDRSRTGKLPARSLVCFVRGVEPIISPMFSKFQLTRVLDVLKTDSNRTQMDKFPKDILQLVNLRYLAIACNDKLHPGIITRCRNLQTLIFESMVHSTNVSHEIFQMPQLREIVFIRSRFRCDFKEPKKVVPQENLHTVMGLEISPKFEVFFAKFPNLKKLGIHYVRDQSDSEFVDLSCLEQLQTLKFKGNDSDESNKFFMNLHFPIPLKKLTVHSSTLNEGYMKTLGMLPNLEFLKLKHLYISKPKRWKPSEGEFCKLRFLVLQYVNFKCWEADETHYPRLEHLKIKASNKLKEIPLRIGEISTLKTIRVIKSALSVAASARKIQKEQLELGNELLQVHVVEDK